MGVNVRSLTKSKSPREAVERVTYEEAQLNTQSTIVSLVCLSERWSLHICTDAAGRRKSDKANNDDN